METHDTTKLEKMVADIATIKSVLNKNKMILQQIMIPWHLIAVAALGGLSIIAICLGVHILIAYYGAFNQIPPYFRYVIYALIAMVAVLSSLIKLRGFSVSGRKIDPNYSTKRLFQEMYSYKIIHLYAPILTLMVFFSFYFTYQHTPAFIVPAIVIGIGLLSNFIGMLVDLRIYLVLGYYELIAALFIIIFKGIPVTIAIAGSLGVGFLLFAVLAYFHIRSGQGD